MLGKSRSGRFPKTESARARVNTGSTGGGGGGGVFFFCATFWTGRFLMGKTSNDRFANKELRPSGICLGATWAGIFCYTEIADLWRLDFIYTGFADAWRLDFIYTEFADTNWSLGDSRGDDIAFVSSQMQAKFRRRFRVVFS